MRVAFVFSKTYESNFEVFMENLAQLFQLLCSKEKANIQLGLYIARNLPSFEKVKTFLTNIIDQTDNIGFWYDVQEETLPEHEKPFYLFTKEDVMPLEYLFEHMGGIIPYLPWTDEATKCPQFEVYKTYIPYFSSPAWHFNEYPQEILDALAEPKTYREKGPNERQSFKKLLRKIEGVDLIGFRGNLEQFQMVWKQWMQNTLDEITLQAWTRKEAEEVYLDMMYTEGCHWEKCGTASGIVEALSIFDKHIEGGVFFNSSEYVPVEEQVEVGVLLKEIPGYDPQQYTFVIGDELPMVGNHNDTELLVVLEKKNAPTVPECPRQTK